MKRSSKGSATQFALVSLLMVIILSTGLFILISNMHHVTVKERDRLALYASFQEILQTALGEVTAESEDKADSYFDFYENNFSYNKDKDALSKSIDGFTVLVREHSGRLPINMTNTNMLFKTKLKSCFKNNVSEFTIKDFRSENGLILNFELFSDFFQDKEDALNFTVYGYANFNTSSEDALAFCGEARTGNSAVGESIRSIAQQYRQQLKIVDETEFNSKIEMRYPDVYPLINIEPVLNINFASEKVIKAVCAYPYGEHPIPNNQALAQNLIELRNQRELLPEDLTRLIKPQKEYPAQNRIFEYFGTVSWFYEVMIEKDDYRATALLMRIPADELDNPVYRIAEYHVDKIVE